MNGMLKGMFEQQGIDVYMGAGVIKDAHTVTVNDDYKLRTLSLRQVSTVIN